MRNGLQFNTIALPVIESLVPSVLPKSGSPLTDVVPIPVMDARYRAFTKQWFAFQQVGINPITYVNPSTRMTLLQQFYRQLGVATGDYILKKFKAEYPALSRNLYRPLVKRQAAQRRMAPVRLTQIEPVPQAVSGMGGWLNRQHGSTLTPRRLAQSRAMPLPGTAPMTFPPGYTPAVPFVPYLDAPKASWADMVAANTVKGVGDDYSNFTWYNLPGESTPPELMNAGVSTPTDADTYQLLDNRYVSRNFITFDPSSYHFFYGKEDITNLLTRAQKESWESFDPVVDNDRLYRQQTIAQTGKDPGGPLETSVTKLFGQYVAKDLSDLFKPSNLKRDVKDVMFFLIIGAAVFLAIERKL